MSSINWNVDAPRYTPPSKPRLPEKATETFRHSLEESGVTEVLSKALAKLCELPPAQRPQEPLKFIAAEMTRASDHLFEDRLFNNIIDDFFLSSEELTHAANLGAAEEKKLTEFATSLLLNDARGSALVETVPDTLEELGDKTLRVLEERLADLCIRAAARRSIPKESTPDIDENKPTQKAEASDSGIVSDEPK
ncbi:unnamed protein product, partial [Mesorhabditis spiculigera]